MPWDRVSRVRLPPYLMISLFKKVLKEMNMTKVQVLGCTLPDGSNGNVRVVSGDQGYRVDDCYDVGGAMEVIETIFQVEISREVMRKIGVIHYTQKEIDEGREDQAMCIVRSAKRNWEGTWRTWAERAEGEWEWREGMKLQKVVAKMTSDATPVVDKYLFAIEQLLVSSPPSMSVHVHSTLIPNSISALSGLVQSVAFYHHLQTFYILRAMDAGLPCNSEGDVWGRDLVWRGLRAIGMEEEAEGRLVNDKEGEATREGGGRKRVAWIEEVSSNHLKSSDGNGADPPE